MILLFEGWTVQLPSKLAFYMHFNDGLSDKILSYIFLGVVELHWNTNTAMLIASLCSFKIQAQFAFATAL